MIKQEEVFKIGRLGKTHGVHGELTFHFDDDIFDRAEAEYLVLDVDGILVPFFLEEYRFRSDATALVKFDGIDTQERARELTNCDVFFPRALVPADDEADLGSSSFLLGFDIVETNGNKVVGRITDIDDSTPNILFQLDNGCLVPAVADLVTKIDQEKRQIHMNLPEGLLDL